MSSAFQSFSQAINGWTVSCWSTIQTIAANPHFTEGGGGGGATGTDSAFDEKALIMSQHYVATTLDLCIASSAPR